MFSVYITLAYVIPNIYMFFRIQSLFISKQYRLWYFLIYMTLFLIYPVGRWFGNDDENIFWETLSTISGYLVPFFLYLFLTLLMFEIFLIINAGLTFVTRKTRKSYRFRFYTLTGMILISVLVVFAGVINLNTIRVSENEIEVPRKMSTLNSLKIVFVSDFHIHHKTNIRYVKKFVREIKDLNPDILLYGGDIVEGSKDRQINAAIAREMKSIHTRYGVFGILGNHDLHGGDIPSFFSKAGITLLNDTLINIDNSFYLAGRLDERIKQRKKLHKIITNSSSDLPLILLDHRPNSFEEASQLPVDIQFSGHTHNGQLFPINYIMKNMYEMPWGYLKLNSTHFFVSSGLRLWGPPVKTTGKSEIVLVNVAFR